MIYFPQEELLLIRIAVLVNTSGTPETGSKRSFRQDWRRRPVGPNGFTILTPAINCPGFKSSLSSSQASSCSAAAIIMPSQNEIFQTSLISEARMTVAGVISEWTQNP